MRALLVATQNIAAKKCLFNTPSVAWKATCLSYKWEKPLFPVQTDGLSLFESHFNRRSRARMSFRGRALASATSYYKRTRSNFRMPPTLSTPLPIKIHHVTIPVPPYLAIGLHGRSACSRCVKITVGKSDNARETVDRAPLTCLLIVPRCNEMERGGEREDRGTPALPNKGEGRRAGPLRFSWTVPVFKRKSGGQIPYAADC
jgi:hypothetical protein